MEQDSMTPPSSPLVQASSDGHEKKLTAAVECCVPMYEEPPEDRDNDCVLFSCVRKDRETYDSGNSVLKRKYFEKFVDNDISFMTANTSSPTVELFGSQFSKCTALVDDMDTLFNLAKMYISKLEMQDRSSSGSDRIFIRKKLRHFFDYIIVSLKCYSDIWAKENHLTSLLNNIKNLHLHIGYLHEVNLAVHSGAGSWTNSEKNSVQYQLFHMYLEVHWAIVQICHCISVRFPGKMNSVNLCCSSVSNSPLDEDLMWQVVSLLLWDIVLLALEKYKQINRCSLMTVSSFQCSCVEDVLIMLRHLLTHRQQTMAKESFLALLQPIILHTVKEGAKDKTLDSMEVENCDSLEMNSDVYLLPHDFECDDPLGFCWWFIMNIVPTFLCDTSGSRVEDKLDRVHSQSFEYILQQLARKSITATETRLRNYLHCCLKLAPFVDTNMQIVSIFWDHFYKKLNETYSVTVKTLGSLPSINKSASGLLEITQKIVLNDPLHQESATSYLLFLHVVCLELQKSTAKGMLNPGWKSMKGRFYSKFHSRRMQELSELGLQHFSLLFLCLAQVADREDVVQKMCDLYSTLNVGKIGTPRRSANWRGCFATILLYVESNTDITFLADKIAASFNAVCSDLVQPDADPSHYSELWTLVDLYTESAQDVVELSQTLNLGQHKLITSGYTEILKVCKEHDLRDLLNFAQTVLTKYRILKHRQTAMTSYSSYGGSDLSDNLWKYFYPFIREHATTQTPPAQLADLAAGFTLLLMDNPPINTQQGIIKESLVQCFGFFSWNETVNAKISCRYLGHLLPNQQVLDHLSRVVPHLEVKLVQSWFKCCFEIKASDEGITELTRLIMKMPAVSVIIEGECCNQTADLATSTFLRAIGNKYASLMDLKSKTEFREKVSSFFSEVPKCLNVLVKNCTSVDIWSNAYQMSGLMVKECAGLLYLKSKPDCLLPILIDKLALPRTMVVQNKPLPSHLSMCLKEHLYLFIQGLARLDYKRDAYVQRKLKDIVIHYLTKFPVGRGSFGLTVTSVHPFLMALGDTFLSEASEDSSNFRRYFVNLVQTEYLSLRGTTTVPQHASTGWTFILDLFDRTACGEVVANDAPVILRTALDYMLMVDNTEWRINATKVMQQVMEAASRYSKSLETSVLQTIIENFFQSHIKVYQTKVLKVLESVAALYPGLFLPLIALITQSVKASEAKRGVGIDKQLRMTYYSLLSQLGEEGNEEKMKLLREATA